MVRANRPLSVTLSQAQPHLAQSPRPRVPAGPTTPMQPQLGSAIPALPTPMAQIPVLPRELPARTSSPATENPPPNDPNVFTLTDRKVQCWLLVYRLPSWHHTMAGGHVFVDDPFGKAAMHCVEHHGGCYPWRLWLLAA